MYFDTSQVDWVFVTVSVILAFAVMGTIFLFNALKLRKWQSRKFGHMLLFTFFAFFPYFFENVFDIVVTVLIAIGIASILSLFPQVKYFQRIYDICTREGEIKFDLVLNTFATAIALLIIFFVFAFRDMLYIYTAAVLSISLGDGLGEVIGRPYGRIKYRVFTERSLEGTLFVFVGTFISIIISFAFNNLLPLDGFWWKAMIVALAGTTAEALNYKFIDNSTMCTSIAFTIFLLFEL
jgi:dolichol kinase